MTRYEYQAFSIRSDGQDEAINTIASYGWRLVQLMPVQHRDENGNFNLIAWFERVRKLTPEELSKGYVPT